MDKFRQPDEAFLRQMIDSLPSAVLVVDDDVTVEFANRTAVDMMRLSKGQDIKRRGGEVMGCLHADESALGCGHAEACRDCMVRNSVYKSYHSQQVVRQKVRLELRREGRIVPFPVLVSASPLDFQDKLYCLLVIEDISELLSLQRLLPICSSCKKIRDDENYWHQVEEYVADHLADIEFTHSMCPDCLAKNFPNYVRKRADMMPISSDDPKNTDTSIRSRLEKPVE